MGTLAFIGGLFGFTGITAIIVGAIVMIGVSFLARKMFGKDKSSNRQDPGQLVNKNANDAPIPIVYGRRRVGATRVFMRTAGADGASSSTQYLHIVYAVAEGPINAYKKIFFNDSLVWENGSTKTSVTNPDPNGSAIDYSGLIEVNTHLGSTTQSADSNLVARFSEWTSAHQGKGIAYVYIRFKYDRDVFPSVPTVTFEIEGRTVRDVDNISGSESYSINPANCIYDYLTHPVYGRNFPSTILNTTTFQDAEDYYDTAHTHLSSPSSRNTFNGSLNPDQTTYENMQEMLANCNSALTYINGKYELQPFKTANSTFTIQDKHIIGGVQMNFGDKATKFNRMRITFNNESDEYQPGAVIIEDSSFKTADNGLELVTDIDLSLVTNEDRAKLIGYELMKQSRLQTTVEFEAPHTLHTIEPMDVVTLDYTLMPENAATLYRVIQSTLTEEGRLLFRLQEYSDSTYTDVDPSTL